MRACDFRAQVAQRAALSLLFVGESSVVQRTRHVISSMVQSMTGQKLTFAM